MSDKSKSDRDVENKNGVGLADLKQKSVRGGAVTIVSQALIALIQLTSTIVLARLLLPSDYGIISMVLAVTSFAALFRDLGLSTAAIQKKTLSNAQHSNLFWLNIAVGLILTVVVASLSPIVSWFYNKEELTLVTVALSFNFFITSLSAQHGAMLIRSMQFWRKSIAGVSGALLNLSVSLSLASNGYHYWSLVFGTLSGAMLTTLLLILLSPFKTAGIKRGVGTRRLLVFGANVTVFNFVNYFSRNLDNVLIGKFWGTEALGFYNRAYQLLMFPITNLRGPIESVAFSALSKLDPLSEQYRDYYCKTIHLLALLTMPLMAWLFVASDEVIVLVLGPNWVSVTPIFTVLALTGFIQPVSSLRGMIMLGAGNSKRNMKAGFITAFVVSVSFCIGCFWGSQGVATAYAVAVWGLLMPMHSFAAKGTSIQWFDLVASCKIPILGSLSGVLLNLLLKPSIEGVSVVAMIAAQASIICLTTIILSLLDLKSRRLLQGVANAVWR